ncbi:hypothetical protein FDB40_12870 [Clostridium botulinum]|nr:hypothetical protein [Clostridium botulinum]
MIDKSNRTKIVKNNILLSVIFKVLGIGISFILVPMTINYLGNLKYGVWATLLGIISWVSYFDIGLGNGLRNKLAESLAQKDYKHCKEYIATTYFSMTIIMLVVSFISLILIYNLSWQKIFNTNSVSENELLSMMLIALIVTLINFVLSIYNQLFYAVQKSSFTGIGQLINSLFNLVFIIIIMQFGEGSLVELALIYCLSMVFTSIIMTFGFFYTNKNIIPNIKDIKISKIKSITNLGAKFFLLQISSLILYTTDNIIVTQMLGPESVTSYSIVRKLFNLVIVGFSIIQAPLWSAYTEAYYKKDYQWIKDIMRKNNYIFIICMVGTVILGIVSPIIFKIWMGPNFIIDIPLIIVTIIYIILNIWCNMYSNFLNGIGKIEIMSIISIISAIINIPISIFCVKCFGISGVVLGTILSMSSAVIIAPIQSIHIIRKL